jgi:hypothetical protein
VQDPVQDGRGDDRVAEDLVPLGEAPVRGQDQGSLFVAAGDELEKQVSSVPVYGDVAGLVDDVELGLVNGHRKITPGDTARSVIPFYIAFPRHASRTLLPALACSLPRGAGFCDMK